MIQSHPNLDRTSYGEMMWLWLKPIQIFSINWFAQFLFIPTLSHLFSHVVNRVANYLEGPVGHCFFGWSVDVMNRKFRRHEATRGWDIPERTDGFPVYHGLPFRPNHHFFAFVDCSSIWSISIQKSVPKLYAEVDILKLELRKSFRRSPRSSRWKSFSP